MTERVHQNPNIIFSIGTQVVALTEVRAEAGRILHPRGAVGIVLKSPMDLRHSYWVRFLDGVEAPLKANEIMLLAQYKEGEIGNSTITAGRTNLRSTSAGLPRGGCNSGPFPTTMPMPFLDRFKVILLDMNGTFMFGQDRFGPGEDFSATYRGLGGNMLIRVEVEQAVRATHDLMASDYENPAKYDDFPQVADVLKKLYPSLLADERNLIEEVLAIHELGHVTDAYAGYLRRLAETHRLGLVANIWCKKDRWLDELERAGVLDLFEFAVFSSDHKSMKPSPKLFDLAFRHFGVSKEEVVFVGDSLLNDIEGAKGFGITAVWIDRDRRHSTCADHVVSDLGDLVA